MQELHMPLVLIEDVVDDLLLAVAHQVIVLAAFAQMHLGTVVATVKNDSLKGRKLLIVQTVDKNLEPNGKPMVAIDAVGAGVGELVFWCRGKEASFPFKREDTPTDCTIVGIVDSEQHVTR
jgi:ethanolamine utilization protein EutN